MKKKIRKNIKKSKNDTTTKPNPAKALLDMMENPDAYGIAKITPINMSEENLQELLRRLS